MCTNVFLPKYNNQMKTQFDQIFLYMLIGAI